MSKKYKKIKQDQHQFASDEINETLRQVVWDELKDWPREVNKFVNKCRKLIANFVTNIPERIKNIPDFINNLPNVWHERLRDARKKKKYRSFRLQKKIKPKTSTIFSTRELLQLSLIFLWKNKRLFVGIIVIHIFVYAIFIRTPYMADAKSIVATVQAVLGQDNSRTFRGSLATMGAVLSSSGPSNAIAISIATLLMSLVYIWTIRHRFAGEVVRVRDAYYQSMTSLLSFVVVLFVISIQLFPLGIASFVYTTARGNNLFISGFEDLAFFTITILIGLLSLYWVSSSVIALYAATLPGVYPIQALAIARNLTKYQRFAVFKRLLALPVVLGLVYMIILMLIIRFTSGYIVYFTEGYHIVILPLIHVYLYKLYRSLI
ncbi:hypothetical protein H6801_00850 [Candidatus Nomurabacteria bacterium]|jgi:hypothetical protein|nr:hypothetical protein [Candidatus Saccharibacteria bacterium]MCB9821908.1 hypothetical protein [Candidatus Nomurabacteria bacterium]